MLFVIPPPVGRRMEEGGASGALTGQRHGFSGNRWADSWVAEKEGEMVAGAGVSRGLQCQGCCGGVLARA